MDDIKREELEKACKKEKDHKIRTRMVAVRMVRVLNMSVEETANLQVHCPTWVRDWLRRYDEGGLEGCTQRGRDSRGTGRRVCSSAGKRDAGFVRARASSWHGADQQLV